MLKSHMSACLLATFLIAAPALAQTSTTANPATTAPATNIAPVTTPAGPAGSTMGANPNATVNTTPGGNAAAGANANAGNAAMAGGPFVTRREPGMYRASELIGMDVRGANNEDIGEVGDVLIDRNGQVRAVVLDIGGFLGIGETHVAVPMEQVQMRPNQTNANAAGTTGGAPAPGATPAGTTGGTPAPGATAAGPAATGAAGQNTAARTDTDRNRTAAASGAARPDMVILVMMTKDQLRNAPKFEDDGRGAGANNAPGTRPAGAAGTGTTPPRQ